MTELGWSVFSFGGYRNPATPHDNKRPGYKGFQSDQLEAVALQCSQDNLHPELIEWADIIISMHRHDWIINNWEKIKHKKVIWRTIGQSIPAIEKALDPYREGLKIVRMSPMEEGIGNYLGKDALIRFYKDPDEYKDWNGNKETVITVGQSVKQRGTFCGFNEFNQATEGLSRALYGPGNEDSGIDGGLLTFEELKAAYRDNRVFFYTGTYPSSYTLGFIEALMTGIPIVAIGKGLWERKFWDMNVYEVDKIISNGINGFISDDISVLSGNVRELLGNPELARKIGQAGRETAIELFGKSLIKKQWKEFLEK